MPIVVNICQTVMAEMYDIRASSGQNLPLFDNLWKLQQSLVLVKYYVCDSYNCNLRSITPNLRHISFNAFEYLGWRRHLVQRTLPNLRHISFNAF
jgi:hypothetical protein